MNVLFVVAEADPLIKTGGLGEVGGSLPLFLSSKESEVRVILPKYGGISDEYKQKLTPVTSFNVYLSWRKLYCGIEMMEYQGIKYYLVDNEYYFNRENIYGYEDDSQRYAFFCKCVLESLTHLNFQPDIIHCNDWHSALIPLMLKEDYSQDPFYYKIRTVLTIHNLKHQGRFSSRIFEDVLGWGGRDKAWERLEFFGDVNFLKAGLLSADALTTVSPTYAEEIQHSFYGEGLEDVLAQRKHQLTGILNGIDTKKYDPQSDPLLVTRYIPSANKTANKKRLQKIMDLPVRGEVPLIAIVSRLVDQKGIDLLAHVLDEILIMELQLVVLGTGEQGYENLFRRYAYEYPHKVGVRIQFDDSLARKIYGGSDMLLMPSLFEPCGLSQMIAMRYGVIPVVRETGGLKDTVQPYNEYTGEGNGFSFANYNAHELLYTIQKAVRVFWDDKNAWQGLVTNAQQSDFSWEKSARRYRDLYKDITGV